MRPCPQCRAEIADTARFCPHCGGPAAGLPPPADAYVGTLVDGKFQVESLLGRGGMGKVYRARHLALDRPVVLKMLHRGLSDDPAVAERFHREAKAASRLNHPNSIAVLDFGRAEDGTLFMAMEYLPGRDLARVIAEEFPLGDARIVRIGSQILSALAEAHARGIVHRDLKPENVMIEARRDEPDFVKVLDFGIAKIQESGRGEARLTQAGLVCGTPEYMSPEQAHGRELDARSDLYSVGVILYQMVTGVLPFHSDTPVGYLTKHLTEQPVPPRRRRADLAISDALDALIVRALAKSPSERFASAEEMREALVAAGRGIAVERRPAAERPPPLEAGPDGARRRRLAPLLAAVALVALALGGSAYLASVRRAPSGEAGLASSGALSPGSPAADLAAPSPATAPPPRASAATPPAERRDAEAAAQRPAGAPAARPAAKPDRARAVDLYQRAEASRAEQDTARAIRLYLAAAAADPSLYQVHKKLALCYQARGDKRRAAEHYRRYLAHHPEDADKVRAILANLR